MKKKTTFSSFDIQIMKQLLDLARTNSYRTHPNPATAAAIVKNGTIISEGIHFGPGRAHAEVDAIMKAGSLAKDSDLYVNLEPCTHFGRTPPCVNAIIKAKIKRVYFACFDPNPNVKNNPAKKILEDNGIEVFSGLLNEEAILLNDWFVKNQVKRRPFVTLKAAITKNGKITLYNEKEKYITGLDSLKAVHRLRSEHDGILVGIGTVLADDPFLNLRHSFESRTSPIKIILDPNGKLHEKLNLFNDDTKVIVITINKNQISKNIINKVDVIESSVINNVIDWDDVLLALYEKGITSLFIEGGQKVFSTCIEQDIVDKLELFVAQRKTGSNDDLPLFDPKITNKTIDALKLNHQKIKDLGNDIWISGYVTDPLSWVS